MIAFQVTSLPDAQRATLEEWRAELSKLVQRQRACPHRERNASLVVHLTSALRNAHVGIGEAGAGRRGELLDHAAEVLLPYVRRRGEARNAAAQLPAFVELSQFLRGPEPESTLRGLADQAEKVAALLVRILAGEVVWSFSGEAAQ